MKIVTYLCTLIMGVLFITASLPSRDSHTTSDLAVSQWNDFSTRKPTSTPSTTEELPHSEETEEPGEALLIRDVTISLGEDLHAVTNKLGVPNRIVDTEYNFDYYVYNNDYRRLLFIAVRADKVVGFYTDSDEFMFHGISPQTDLNSVNKALDKNYTMNEILTYHTAEYTAKILLDTVESETVTGIYVLDNSLELGEYPLSVSRNIELLNFDLINSIRARHNLPLLSWSSTAAKAARRHSKDMAENDYFDHISLFGNSPGDRLREEGQNYTLIAENIIAGYGTAILSNHAWYTSLAHRNNLLNPEYTSVGVGFVYLEDSPYKTYMTQEFYR